MLPSRLAFAKPQVLLGRWVVEFSGSTGLLSSRLLIAMLKQTGSDSKRETVSGEGFDGEYLVVDGKYFEDIQRRFYNRPLHQSFGAKQKGPNPEPVSADKSSPPNGVGRFIPYLAPGGLFLEMSELLGIDRRAEPLG